MNSTDAPTITLTADDFAALTAPTLTFTSADATLPILHHVLIESVGQSVTAEATDRFRVVKTHVTPDPAETADVRILLHRDVVKGILNELKSAKRGHKSPDAVSVTVTAGSATVKCWGELVTDRKWTVPDGGTWPRLNGLISRHLAMEPVVGPMTVDPARMTGLLKAAPKGSSPSVWVTEDRFVLCTAPGYLAMLTGRRGEGDAVEDARAEWSGLLP